MSCVLTYDSADRLTALRCDIDELSFNCTSPADAFVCRWSDDPDCADVYSPSGVFEAYLCNAALDERLGRDVVVDNPSSCSHLENTEPYIQLTITPEEAPTPVGGSIVDGVYRARSMTQHRPNVRPGSLTLNYRSTLIVQNGVVKETVEVMAGFATTVEEYSVAGTRIVLDPLCWTSGAPEMVRNFGFSAEDQQLTLFNTGGANFDTLVTVFERVD